MSDRYPYLTEDDEFDCENGSPVDLMVLVNSIRAELAAARAEVERLKAENKDLRKFISDNTFGIGYSYEEH